MSMKRIDVAKGVAARLFEVEDAIDGSLKQASRLIADMVDARRDLRLAAVVGQAAFARTAATINALAQARGEIIGAHDALAETRDRMGMRTVGLGALDKPDPPAGGGNFMQAQAPAEAAQTLPSKGENVPV